MRPDQRDAVAAHRLLSHRALDVFSLDGTPVVAAIVISGLVNGWRLISPAKILGLPGSPYGLLLLLKLLLFGAQAERGILYRPRPSAFCNEGFRGQNRV